MIQPFAALWASFLSWYHDPSRILGQFDRVQRRLHAASRHHDEQNVAFTLAAANAQAQATAHASAAARATNVSVKLAELLT